MQRTLARPLPFLFQTTRRFSDLSAYSSLGVGFSQTQKPSQDADSISKILIQHHNPFHAMESSLQLNGINLSHDLVFQTLLRLRNVTKIALGFFDWAKSHPNYTHDVAIHELMIDIFGRVRQFDVAWQFIIEMDQNGLKPSPRSFEILIRRYIAAGLTRQAIRTFDDMATFVERDPDQGDFVILLDTLSKYGYIKVATEIFNKRKSVFEPNSKMYTVLIYGWCKVNRVDMAERFLREMIDKGLDPNVVTYNVILNGICRRSSLHPEERFERTVCAAEKVFDEMRVRGIEPDTTSYSIVLHVYSRAHKPELSLCKFRSMRESGICPTVATYTSVIKCLCSCGRMQDAEGFLSEMVDNGVSPSSATYNCFFKEFRGRKDAESALKLYGKMKDSKCSTMPSLHTYNILIGMFVKLGKMEIIRQLWSDMKESGIGPDLDSYTSLIHGLCEKQKWREACEFFMEMIEKGYLPQKITFETLYKGLIQSDMMRTWRRLKKKVDEESLKFGTEFHHYHLKPYKR